MAAHGFVDVWFLIIWLDVGGKIGLAYVAWCGVRAAPWNVPV